MTAESSSFLRLCFNADPFCESCGLQLEEVESAGDSLANTTITILTDCKERRFTGQVGRGTLSLSLKCAMEWECHHGGYFWTEWQRVFVLVMWHVRPEKLYWRTLWYFTTFNEHIGPVNTRVSKMDCIYIALFWPVATQSSLQYCS